VTAPHAAIPPAMKDPSVVDMASSLAPSSLDSPSLHFACYRGLIQNSGYPEDFIGICWSTSDSFGTLDFGPGDFSEDSHLILWKFV
jgi:hypothetical protein